MVPSHWNKAKAIIFLKAIAIAIVKATSVRVRSRFKGDGIISIIWVLANIDVTNEY